MPLNIPVQIARGVKATLPLHATDGLFLVTRDTQELFMGQGESLPLLQLNMNSLYNFSGVAQSFNFSKTVSVQSAVIGSNYVMISSNIDCHFATGINPVAGATSPIMLTGRSFVVKVGIGNKIAIFPMRPLDVSTVASSLTYFCINELL